MHGGTVRAENAPQKFDFSFSYPCTRVNPELCKRLSRAGEVGAGWVADMILSGPCPVRRVPPRLQRSSCAEIGDPGTPWHPRPCRRCRAQPRAPTGPRGCAALTGWRFSTVAGKSSQTLACSPPSGQVCSAPLPLPVWKPLQPQTGTGKVPDGFPLHLAVQCCALLVCKSSK